MIYRNSICYKARIGGGGEERHREGQEEWVDRTR